MMLEGKKTSFALTMIASALLAGCNSSDSDPKLSPVTEKEAATAEISGVALDGYLKNAQVCIDMNHNLSCDSGDSQIVTTDAQGRYTLTYDGIDLSKYHLLVEALASQTVDMDSPNAPILDGFSLSAPADTAAVISPLTTLTLTVARQLGVDFQTAATMLAQTLDVDRTRLTSDFLAGSHTKDKQLHALAQGLTALMQEAEKASLSNGVILSDVRSGLRMKLGLLDVKALKSQTDPLVGTTSHTTAQIRDLVQAYVPDITITREEMEGAQLLVQPRAPKAPDSGALNINARTFDWQWVGLLTSQEHYEFSIDAGEHWHAVAQKPLHLDLKAYQAGDIQVRVKADSGKGFKAGQVLKSEQPLAQALVPAAPAAVRVDDARNQFDWDLVPGHDHATAYEYSVDRGMNWQIVHAKPQPVGDVMIAAGDLKVRVAADGSGANPHAAGLAASSSVAFTQTPQQPAKPSGIQASDETNFVDWDYVDSFTNYADYEVSLDNGQSWTAVSQKPLSVGNLDIAKGAVQLRVAANLENGMPAGEIAVVDQAFTQEIGKPGAPSQGTVNDVANQFDWVNVAGFDDAAFYEISLDSGQTWLNVNGKPAAIPDEQYAAGQVCVRVKANAKGNHPAGEILCSLAPFTETPATPVAPTAPLTNDSADTFGWAWTPGFTQATDYEIQIQGQDWQPVNGNPHALAKDGVFAAGEVQVRVKAEPLTGREASAALSNTVAFTVKPDQPAAPTQPVADDTANTFDWTFVPAFTLIGDYEYSLNGGQSWQSASAKPIVVGDVNLAAGQVQVRVKANVQNGMPAGQVLKNTTEFISGEQPDAPTSPEVVNKNFGDRYNEVKTNGLRWVWTDSTYDSATHYEFTNDGGTTWHPVTSNPQHIGPQAYDKTRVGVRVKADAIEGESNAPGQVMWATDAAADFVALRVVPLTRWDQPVALSSYNGNWSGSAKCYAEYDVAGEGEPQFWTYKGDAYSDEKSDIPGLIDSAACGLTGWVLLSKEDTIAKNTGDSSYIPSSWDDAFIINDSYPRYWATSMENGQPTFVAVQNGQVVDLSTYSTADIVTTWFLPETATLLTDAASLRTDLQNLQTSTNAQWQTVSAAAVSLIDRIKTVNQVQQATLLSDIATFGHDTESVASNLQQQIDANAKRLAVFALYQHMLDIREGLDATHKRTILQDIETATLIQADLVGKQQALAAVQQIATAMAAVTNVKVGHAALLLQVQALNHAGMGSDIHAQSLSLYEAIAALSPLLDPLTQSNQALQAALVSLAGSDDQTLLDALKALETLVLAQPDVDSVADYTTQAENGLVRAHHAGYVVTSADALVGQHFSKLDIHGRFLPTSTTYAQGWRCVLDNRDPARARTWTLLKDGLPEGQDDLAFDASASGLPSVLGAGGLLETANAKVHCGRSDWKLPHPAQLQSLETATVNGKNTIDTSVFPHHLALLPEYDKPRYDGETSFDYWTSEAARWTGTQYIYRHPTANMDSQTTYDYTNGGENNLVLGRLLAEHSPSYQLLDKDGNVVTDIAQAKCAYQPDSKLTWQLFDSSGDERRLKYSAVQAEVGTQNAAQLCNKTNWRVPALTELQNLLPINTSVFRHNESDNRYYRCYFTDQPSGSSDQACYDMTESKVIAAYDYSSYMYRLVASD
ncbi:DUF1566 domain-containing protein [Photobacterium sp. TY1-4]|uniref:DUF1566 domain-containing protein n=1 Tax=Photobacterium sp. TY1-4 TaxID=2899122 RepID=UPI0021C0ABA3|nr:DUF1566 domain-containing protein [Photobacterium sp. TY1-4]UXI03622.1 DUF1566 domain-containing protein [Photobacterium sp. TY1-4]